MMRVIVTNAVKHQFTVNKLTVPARRAINRVTILPGKSMTFLGLQQWDVKTIAFAPTNGGSYRIDTRAGEIAILLPEAPVDKFQFALRDMFENFATWPAVLVRGHVDQKLAMLDADELALDYSPGTLIVVYDAATKTWGL